MIKLHPYEMEELHELAIKHPNVDKLLRIREEHAREIAELKHKIEIRDALLAVGIDRGPKAHVESIVFFRRPFSVGMMETIPHDDHKCPICLATPKDHKGKCYRY